MSESVLPEGRFSSGGWVHLMRVHFTTEDRAFSAAPALDQGSRRVLGAAGIFADPVARQISVILGPAGRGLCFTPLNDCSNKQLLSVEVRSTSSTAARLP